ncbi:MAG TPA: Na+/H+ antiporter NhaC family protein [Rhodanobacteraceae bacterium]
MRNSSSPARALWPIVLFLLLFFGTGVYFTLRGDAHAFYRLHAPVALLPALALALWLGRRGKRAPQAVLFEGMGEPGIMLMCLIFILAGAFASVTRHIGGVDAVVHLGMTVLPPGWMLPGMFIMAALVSLAMGTSMGTIAAIAPIGVGLAQAAGLNLPLLTGAIVGGAMFGDNLSVISDTTIAATRTQGAGMRDKFRENVWVAVPAALATAVVLALLSGGHAGATIPDANAWLALPYALVLVLAVAGVDVLAVLGLGIVVAGVMGMALVPGYGVLTLAADVWQGCQSMFEITLLSILIGGLAALMREQGGLHWLADKVEALLGRGNGRVHGEIGIAALGALTDGVTANNTVAILVVGPVAKDLAERHGISPGRSASLLDIFSCVVQGVLPYGAQILLAASIAGLPPLAIAGRVPYCWALAIVTVLAMLANWPRRQLSRTPPIRA